MSSRAKKKITAETFGEKNWSAGWLAGWVLGKTSLNIYFCILLQFFGRFRTTCLFYGEPHVRILYQGVSVSFFQKLAKTYLGHLDGCENMKCIVGDVFRQRDWAASLLPPKLQRRGLVFKRKLVTMYDGLLLNVKNGLLWYRGLTCQFWGLWSRFTGQMVTVVFYDVSIHQYGWII